MGRRLDLRLSVASVVLASTLTPALKGETGTIRGKAAKADALTAVTAIDRATDKKYSGKIDAKSGEFTITDLPLGATYDCILDAGSVRLEGVNLKVPRSEYEEEQPLTKEDIETIKKTALSLNKFENEIEILTVAGNIQHTAVVLNKKRTTPFYESKPGEMIWRLELWHFEKPDETWIKVQEEFAIVFYRQRLQKSDFAKKALTLDSILGGIKLDDKQKNVELGTIVLPSKEPGIRLRT
ncbi:MAG TPA: hypothetical protein VH643_12110, partial [Gemmataceae bacterium]